MGVTNLNIEFPGLGGDSLTNWIKNPGAVSGGDTTEIVGVSDPLTSPTSSFQVVPWTQSRSARQFSWGLAVSTLTGFEISVDPSQMDLDPLTAQVTAEFTFRVGATTVAPPTIGVGYNLRSDTDPYNISVVASGVTNKILQPGTTYSAWITLSSSDPTWDNLSAALDVHLAPDSGSWVQVGDISVYPGPFISSRPWFSGSSPNSELFQFSWVGTANDSLSTRTNLKSINSNVISWSITEPNTPHVITNLSGGVGTSTVRLAANEESYFLPEEDATMSIDDFAGTFLGSIDSIGLTGFEDSGSVALSITSTLSLLNVERTMEPVQAMPLSQIIAHYVAQTSEKISVSYVAIEDPEKTYSGWTGNVWNRLKELLSINRLETSVSDNALVIRDIGLSVLDVTDNSSVVVSTAIGTGKYVELTARQSRSISNATTWNYASNPSLETNSVGWDYEPSFFGSATVSRVTN